MQIIRELGALRTARGTLTGRVALVPTMGALHAGHLALVEEARRRAEHVVVSIFVNPLQFGPNEDLARYPRQEAADAALLEGAGVDLLWAPDAAAMYPPGFATTVSVRGVSETFDGAHRPGHFDGVATVVAKLFGQVRPDLAIFGEKDWQQLAVVRRLVADLDLGIEIVGLPTVREADGVALSSRNAYLSPEERARAAELPRALAAVVAAVRAGGDPEFALTAARELLSSHGFRVDYVALVDANMQPNARAPERLIAAARLGSTRLIDNMPIE